MTGTLGHLLLASLAFVASHLVMSSGPFRGPVVRALGEWPFKGLYAAVSVAALAWMILAYLAAPEVVVFEPLVGMRHASLTLMVIAEIGRAHV